MSESTKAVVRTEHGVVAEITLHPDYTYTVDAVVRKEALAHDTVASALNALRGPGGRYPSAGTTTVRTEGAGES